MKLNWTFKLVAAFALFAIAVIGCKKEDAVQAPPEIAHFTNLSGGSYSITGPGVTYKIPVGFTTVSDKDRTVTVSVSSPTGAVQGTHYTLPATTVTIPAGKAVDSLTVSGNYAQYLSGRKDTLVFTIVDAKGAATNEYNSVYKLFMRGPCFEADAATDYQFLNGAYQARESGFNSNGTTAYSNYGPYAVTVKDATLTSPTTATITVSRLYEMDGWTGTFTLDWTDLTTRKVTTTSQRLGSGAAIGLSAYDIYLEPPSTTQNLPNYGTYTFCNNDILLKFRLGARDPSSGALAGYLSASSGGGSGTFTMRLTR